MWVPGSIVEIGFHHNTVEIELVEYGRVLL
jgi:hypothetical protein